MTSCCGSRYSNPALLGYLLSFSKFPAPLWLAALAALAVAVVAVVVPATAERHLPPGTPNRSQVPDLRPHARLPAAGLLLHPDTIFSDSEESEDYLNIMNYNQLLISFNALRG